MLLHYVAPNGHTYQYEEGEQPDGYVLADRQPLGYKPKKTPAKRRTTANKARKATNK